MSDGQLNGEVSLPWHAHLVAGWPLIMVILGGAIGGGCGGLAYFLSTRMIRRSGVRFSTYLFSTIVGLTSLVFYALIIGVLTLIFPNLFREN